MTHASESNPSASAVDGSDFLESLRQAFARQPRPLSTDQFEPLSLTIAMSREAGSRGGTIAKKVGTKLGWQVYDHELLEYLAQEPHLGQELFAALDAPAATWVEERLRQLRQGQALSDSTSIAELARVILAIGARGQAVVLGRGSGCLLPPATTLHVRVIAPLADRIAYLSQAERLTAAQAAEQVHLRDGQRIWFVETHFHRRPSDIYQYDLLVNSSMLGEELTAELIVRAALTKLASQQRDEGAPPVTVPEPLG
jgi:cytidylate kinase